MARLGTVVREGIPLALHSDFTMAPARPLHHAWVAVNRRCESGEVAGPEERLTLEQALRAITIDAAFVLGMEDEIGSIRPESGPISRCWRRTRSRSRWMR